MICCVFTLYCCVAELLTACTFLEKAPTMKEMGRAYLKAFFLTHGSSIFDTSIELKSTGLTPA